MAQYERLLGAAPSHRSLIESDGVEAVMFQLGENRVELLGSCSDTSKIAKFLQMRGSGLHHVAYRVDDVQTSLDEYAQMGLRLLDTKPRLGAAGRKVAFLHPSAGDGVLTELCEMLEAEHPG